MRKNLFTLILLCSAFAINAQTTVGLIAHWDMNGTTNDVSGNGHDGNANNLIPAAGEDGVMGHAWAFNGLNSYITIPYSPDLNVSGYTISATIKVEGFYSGPCHSNEIFCRGTTHGGSFGTYFLDFTDWPAGYGCTTTTVDSALESFMPAACGSGTCFDPASESSFDYSPHIIKNQWYNVVATFNDTVFNVYVNGVLKSTDTITTPGVAMGTSTDSASIGYSIYDAGAGYPYAFNGILDDIRLYNRALSDSEVIHLDPFLSVKNAVVPANNISLFPNPATTQLTVTASDKISSVIITNILGQTISSHEYNTTQVQIDIANFPAGVYFVKINGTDVKNFVKE